MQNELPASSSVALLPGGSGGWEGQPLASRRADPFSYLHAGKAAGGKGRFLLGCRCRQIRSVSVARLVLDLSGGLCGCGDRGGLELPGRSEHLRWGQGGQQPGIPQPWRGDVQPLPHHAPLEQGTALETPQNPSWPKEIINTGDIFPLPFPYIVFFSASAQFFGKHKALCLFWVQKEASSFYFKNDLVEMRLYPCFSVLAWPEAVFLSLLQKTDKADEDRGALPVREQEGAWSGCRVDC